MVQTEKDQLLEIILRDGYAKGKFILSSGKESDFYIDLRKVTLQPQGALCTAKIILYMVKDVDYDAIGGPTLGADPMIGAIGVVSLQDGNPRPTFIIRKAAKSHGKQQQLEGPEIKEGAKVVIIDDVATTGKAFLHSIDVLKGMNIEVARAICIVDRNEGAKEAVAEKGVQLESIFDISEIHK